MTLLKMLNYVDHQIYQYQFPLYSLLQPTRTIVHRRSGVMGQATLNLHLQLHDFLNNNLCLDIMHI